MEKEKNEIVFDYVSMNLMYSQTTKEKNRRRLTKTPKYDMGIAPYTINPQIPQLCKNHLSQISHTLYTVNFIFFKFLIFSVIVLLNPITKVEYESIIIILLRSVFIYFTKTKD